MHATASKVSTTNRIAMPESASIVARVLQQSAAVVARVPLEAFVWVAALAALAATDPAADGLFSLCPFDALGLTFCPGCGLGHAIAFFMHGDVAASVQAHPLGIPAVGILGGRIVTLVRGATRTGGSLEADMLIHA